MPKIYNPPQKMRALVMHHVVGATDDQLQKMRPLEVYLTNIGGIVQQEIATQQGSSTLLYAAYMTQSSTNNPAVTELMNTIDATLTWARDDVGTYSMSPLSGTPFPQIRTMVLVSPAGDLVNGTPSGTRIADDTIEITTRNSAGNLADGVIANGLYVYVLVFPDVS